MADSLIDIYVLHHRTVGGPAIFQMKVSAVITSRDFWGMLCTKYPSEFRYLGQKLDIVNENLFGVIKEKNIPIVYVVDK